MPTSRTKLIKNIIVIENRLNSQSARVMGHKKFFRHWVHDNRSLLFLALIPAFIWGWGRGGRKKARHMASKLLNVSWMVAIKMVVKHLFDAR